MVKIILDTKGADRGPDVMIKGAQAALEKFPELAVLFVGDADMINARCAELGISPDRFETVDAPDEITNYDSPAEAIFKKQESSMLTSLRLLSERDDLFGMVTMGNTGVLIAGGIRHLSLPERKRPALAAVLPAENGGFTCLVDTGATVDCTPEMLHSFALLGSQFMRESYSIASPKVGLLSNGAEPTKGNKLVKETYPILASDERLNFVGNIEGSNALSGDCDVLVCDGFAGNQVMKVTEGSCARIITDIVKYAKRTESSEIMKLAGHLMSVYDISSLGGAILLGVSKPVIKARGNAGEKMVSGVSEMLINMASSRAMFDPEKNKI